MLPDEVLLEIFELYIAELDDEEGGLGDAVTCVPKVATHRICCNGSPGTARRLH